MESTFVDAATVFLDEQAVTIQDDRSEEERFVTVGADSLGRLLVVVYPWRGGQHPFDLRPPSGSA